MDDYTVTALDELIPRGAAGTSDNFVREIGNVFKRPGGGYGLLYAGMDADSGDASVSHVQVHLATSPHLYDGGMWTKHGIVLPQATLGFYTEDPYVITYNDVLWCFVEKRATSVQQDIVLLRSTDGGLSWTLIADPILGDSVDATSFDKQDTSSPVVWQEGTRLYMLYEGRSAGDDGKIGLAWSDTGPGGAWTKHSLGVNEADPVIDRVPASWYANSLVTDDLVRRDGRYYLIAHGNGGSGYRCGVFEADSPLGPWVDGAGAPITDTAITTLMLADHPAGLEMVAANERSADATYMSIVRFQGWGELARAVKAGPAAAERLYFGDTEVGAAYLDDVRVFGRTLADAIPAWLSDRFSGTAGTTIEAHTPDIGGAGWTRHPTSTISGVLSDAGRARSGTGTVIYFHSIVPPSADYTVECDVVVITEVGTDTGPAGRMDVTAATYYTCRANVTSDAFELQRVVAGTGTVIGSWAVPGLLVVGTYRVVLRMVGTQISVDIDDVQRISVADANIAAAGKAGFRLSGGATNTSRVHIDNLAARPA